jgi:hypothetical protein
MKKKSYSKTLTKLLEDVRSNPQVIKTSDIKSLTSREQMIFSKYLTELMIETSAMNREEQIKN